MTANARQSEVGCKWHREPVAPTIPSRLKRPDKSGDGANAAQGDLYAGARGKHGKCFHNCSCDLVRVLLQHHAKPAERCREPLPQVVVVRRWHLAYALYHPTLYQKGRVPLYVYVTDISSFDSCAPHPTYDAIRIMKRGPSCLLQTRVQQDVAEGIKKEARLSGDSIAEWLRRLLTERHHGRLLVAVWVRHASRGGSDAKAFLASPNRGHPVLLLEIQQHLPAGERVCVVCRPPHARFMGEPMPWSELSKLDFSTDPLSYRFFLDGSPTAWEATAMYRTQRDSVELAIRPAVRTP